MEEKLPIDTVSVLLVEKDGFLGGYRPELLKENIPTHFENFVICSKCDGLMREACGVRDPQVFMCGVCAGSESRNYLIPNSSIIMNMIILCPLKSRGCEWEGIISSADAHLDTCDYFHLECPLSCSGVIKRMDMETHVTQECKYREIECKYCSEYIKDSETCFHVSQVCISYPIQCENVCGEKIQRQHMQFHIDDICPNTPIDCDYSKYGCCAKIERKCIDAHNYDNRLPHMELLMQTGLKNLTEELDRVNQENRIMKEQIKTIKMENIVKERTLVALADGYASLRQDLDKLKSNNEEESKNLLVYQDEFLRDHVRPMVERVDELEKTNTEIKTELTNKAEINSMEPLTQKCRDLEYLSSFQFKRRFIVEISEDGPKIISENWEETKNSPVRVFKLQRQIFRDENGVVLVKFTGIFNIKQNCNSTIRTCIAIMNQPQEVIQSIHKFTVVPIREEIGNVRSVQEASKVTKKSQTTQQYYVLAHIPLEEMKSENICINDSVSIQVYFDFEASI